MLASEKADAHVRDAIGKADCSSVSATLGITNGEDGKDMPVEEGRS
jgi:hypothetical protein